MKERHVPKALVYIEIAAYILAIWSFLVLFLEPIISFYTNYRMLENFTALANIFLLSFTIIKRFSLGNINQHRTIIISDLAMLFVGSLLMIYQAKFVIFFLLIRQTYFILQYLIFRSFEGKIYRLIISNPPVSFMLSFIGVILIGSVFLMLPVSSAEKAVTPFLDALFTSTSATCVTGLIVYDTSSYFSTFGQMVILILIQVGGLGIMTVSTAFALILGQRLTLKLENVMQNVMSGVSSINLFELLKNIVLVTVIIETIGAVLLYATFARIYEPLQAVYFSVFHSISAFCNAGFALTPDSFMTLSGNVNVTLTITSLIILGGIGFAVLIDMQRYFTGKTKNRKLTLHTKLVLSTTGVLLITAFVLYFIAEYSHTMKDFSFGQRILASWFQSVTTRTAGFNSIDTAGLSKASILITLVLMFIGASPGSTGGGIKTSTFALLILTVSSLLRGKRELTVYNRKISASNYREAVSLIVISAGIIFVIVFFLMMVDTHSFVKIIFEAISAFGTVGLSMGITSELTNVGKLLITILMYVGRIGPLTLIYAFATRKIQGRIWYAEEKIAIG